MQQALPEQPHGAPSCSMAMITCADKWHHACRGGNLPPATFRIQPVWTNGTTQCSGDDPSPFNVAMITCADERHHISTCHPEGAQRVEGSSQVANFILWWFFFQRGGFLHSADAAVGMPYRGSASTDSPTVSTTFHAPRGPHQARPGSPRRASFPQGKLLYRVGRHTGYFLRRDNRKVPGTAHRPFPTVSLKGGTVHPHRLYSGRGGRLVAAPTDTLVGDTIHSHGLYSERGGACYQFFMIFLTSFRFPSIIKC